MSRFALGDVVVLTAAVREFHRCYAGQFDIDVETSFPEVWNNNPYVKPAGPDAIEIECQEVSVDRTGARGIHYAQAYLELINSKLQTQAELSDPRGDIHLSSEEKRWHSDIWTLCGREAPFWLISAGGKFDIPIKWWDARRYQAVVDHFRGRIQFVQVGAWGDYHPRLEGAIDLRGKTSVRDLIHLMHYARGVVCGVTSLMHLAAAVPSEDGSPRNAVIVAGAREPAVWEAYPGHIFLETSGQVECAHCWRSRFEVIPDGAASNRSAHRCLELSDGLPRCMDLISAERVIAAIESLGAAGRWKSLSRKDRAAVHPHHGSRGGAEDAEGEGRKKEEDFDRHNVHPLNSVAKAEEFIASIPRYPRERFRGRGIVICGGGVSYFTNAWVCIRMLRKLGCTLPVEVWHLGRHELDRKMERLIAPWGVRCVNAREVMNSHPFRNPLGWELKAYALLNSSFREVLSLDADNVPVRNPEYLLDCPEYRETGAVFWPDYGRLSPKRPIWRLCGVPYRDEPEFESGQMVVNKERCWRALKLAFWYNDHSEFFYRYIHGDKDTFHLAWRRLEMPYSMPPYPIRSLRGTMCQHDFSGKRIFQHRNLLKWEFFKENARVKGFLYESECLQFLEELRQVWDGTIRKRPEVFSWRGFKFRKNSYDQSIFKSVVQYNEYQLPEVFAAKDAIVDVGAHIGSFAYACQARGSRAIYAYEPDPRNFDMAKENAGRLPGVYLTRAAVLHAKQKIYCGNFPTDGGGLNTGGAAVLPCVEGTGTAAGGRPLEARALAIDSILKSLRKVKLIKLDCEGSEWPILAHATELGRAESICGEYHEMDSHPLCPGLKRLNRKLLRALLRLTFKYVRTIPESPDSPLGKFWASHLKFHGDPRPAIRGRERTA